MLGIYLGKLPIQLRLKLILYILKDNVIILFIALLASVGDVEQVAELYFGCKLCSENVALYQGEDTFLEHIRECHAEYCTEPQPDEKPVCSYVRSVLLLIYILQVFAQFKF